MRLKLYFHRNSFLTSFFWPLQSWFLNPKNILWQRGWKNDSSYFQIHTNSTNRKDTCNHKEITFLQHWEIRILKATGPQIPHRTSWGWGSQGQTARYCWKLVLFCTTQTHWHFCISEKNRTSDFDLPKKRCSKNGGMMWCFQVYKSSFV